MIFLSQLPLTWIPSLDCQTHHDFGHTTSGLYNITHNSKTMAVYCHMKNGEGWIAIQRRVTLEDYPFYHNWQSLLFLYLLFIWTSDIRFDIDFTAESTRSVIEQ